MTEYRERRKKRFGPLRRLLQRFLSLVAGSLPSYKIRVPAYRLMGVNVEESVYIGRECFLDPEFPELITIKKGAIISSRVIIAAHDSSRNMVSPVVIEEKAFIGAGAILLPGVTIGSGAVVGAGAVVTKDVPPGSTACGNPARPVSKKRPGVITLLSLLLALFMSPHPTMGMGNMPKGYRGVGGLEKLPEYRFFGKNLLKNPGFEEGFKGWKYWDWGRCYSIDKKVSHSGKKSLMYTPGSNCPPIRQLDIKLDAVAFIIRGWIKTERINKDGGVAFYLFDHTHGGGVLYGFTAVKDNTRGWKFVEEEVLILPGHKGDRVELRIIPKGINKGRVWIDDLEIKKTYKPLDVFIRYPNFRGYLWEDKKQEVDVLAEIRPPQGVEYRDLLLHVSVEDPLSGKEVISERFRNLSPRFPFTINMAHLPLGEYLLHFSLKDMEGKVIDTFPDFRVVKVSKEFRDSLDNWIDENNILHHKGRPRFVWGIYDRISSARCVGCIYCEEYRYENIKGFDGKNLMDTYADVRVNVVLNFVQLAAANPGIGRSCNQIKPYISALHRRGIMHLQIVNHYFGDGGDCYPSNRYRPWWASLLSDEELWKSAASLSYDGLLGFYTADEPGVASPVTLCGAFKQYQVLKQNYGTITYAVFLGPANIQRWFYAVDVFGTDPYPLGGGPLPDDNMYGETHLRDRRHFPRTYGWTVDTVKAVKESRPVWQVLQLFRSGGRFPTYEDMKNQVWAAIVGGAKGILWWGFVSSVGVEREWYRGNKKAYYDFKRISHEVMALEPILLSPDADVALSVNSYKVAYRIKQISKKKYLLIAVNKGEDYERDVTFLIDSKKIESVKVYAESRMITPQDNQFTDDFAPEAAHVYFIKTR